ncbi:polysaccharide lyase [Blastococcus saxobsidens]|uniref:Polysaccharide lyase-like protein n=1 Tax=Blastococcus saxobsidens TaxID=138336 RepID=A0A4Q7YB59_9ACTN|nr:polysaccharide lyase [Blastococcus saxobsidens]RZU34098.1 polysaccharide lyase-like protein [Blastococcus saxobsidens]
MATALLVAGCGSEDPPAPPVDTVSTPIETSEVPASELSDSGATSSPGAATRTAGDPEHEWSYADGTLDEWSEVQVARPEQVEVVQDPVRPGYEYAAAFTAGPGDHTFGVTTTIRGEVRSTVAEAGSPTEGDVQWYSWSSYFPEDFEWDGEDEFLIYTQWHQESNSGSPNIDLWVTDGDDPQLRLSVRGGLLGGEVSQYTAVYDLGPLVLGEWLDHTVRIDWSADPDEGETRVWIDGERKVHAVAANLYEGQSVYFKQGIYAASNTDREHTVYFTDARRGPSRESVAIEPPGD